MSISAVILTKNEEKNIADAISSVAWCDEVLIIDDNSEDKTIKIAQKMNAQIYHHALKNDFASQRNFGLERTKGDWVLFLDADERVSQSLAFEIQGKIVENAEGIQGYYIMRHDSMWGKVLRNGEVGNISLLRLAKRNAGKWKGIVHEVWDVKGKTATLSHPLLHVPHPTITEFLEEINFYTTLRASELFEKKVSVSWWKILVYPKAKFFVNYFLRQGWRDGIPGLIVAVLMSFHSFLVRGKLWILWHKK